MKSFFLGQNQNKANHEIGGELKEQKNTLVDRYDEKNIINKILKSPYQQSLKKQYQSFNNKTMQSPERALRQDYSQRNQGDILDHVMNISSHPERCYINRIVEYRIPNKIRNNVDLSCKKLYDSINYDDNESDALIIRQKSYLRLTPDNLLPKIAQKQQIQEKQQESTNLFPLINRSATIENCKTDSSVKFSNLRNDSIHDQQAIKRIIRKNHNINERLIQQINLKYLQQSRSISPLLNENINIRNSEYTSFSKQNKQNNKSILNQSYNFNTLNTINDNRTPIRRVRPRNSYHNQSLESDNINLRNNSSMRRYLNTDINPNEQDNSYLNISINQDLIKLRK